MITDAIINIDQATAECQRLFELKKFAEIYDFATGVIKSAPNAVNVKFIASLACIELQKNDEAEILLQECNLAVPNNFNVYFNLGIVYNRQNRIKEAAVAYEKVLELNPGHLGTLNNLANIYNVSGNSAMALEYLNRILAVNDKLYFIYNNIALIYKKVGMLNEALAYILKAVELNPDGFEQHHNAALIYTAMAKNKLAVKHYAESHRLAPEDLFIAMGYHDLLGKVCQWETRAELEPLIAKLLAEKGEGYVPPVMTDVQKNENSAKSLAVAREFTFDTIKQIVQIYEPFSHDLNKRKGKKGKLRIGYMSADIKDHPVAHLMRGVFKHHDKENFEIFLYSFSPTDRSGYKEQIESYCDRFIDIRPCSNYETARVIYNDEVDILIDLNGHTGPARVEALYLKPAPIQVNYLGFIGTMGADFIDYIITDKIVTPPEHQQFYTEKFVYMPDCYQANDDELAIAQTEVTRASEGLPEDKFIFCSFNQTYKIEPVMFDVWMNILKRAPNSVLWLYRGSIFPDDDLAVENIRKEAAKRGIGEDRIIFANAKLIGEHLKRVSLADIALDTRLYNGGTVTSQTLWAGVPVVTLEGWHFASRMASSILSGIHMPELVTKTPEEYENLAVELAQNPDEVRKLKEKLHKNIKQAPLFNTELFTRNLEKAYRLMWENYVKGDMPLQIQVA